MKTYQINYDIPEDQKPTDKETVFTVSFMSRYGFVPKIRSGEKGITIRNTRKDGKLPQPGQVMRMWADQRSPERESIFKPGELEPRCTGVWPVEIGKLKGGGYYITTNFLKEIIDFSTTLSSNNANAINQFARLDGWDTPEEMFNFFSDSLPFKGFAYCWVKL